MFYWTRRSSRALRVRKLRRTSVSLLLHRKAAPIFRRVDRADTSQAVAVSSFEFCRSVKTAKFYCSRNSNLHRPDSEDSNMSRCTPSHGPAANRQAGRSALSERQKASCAREMGDSASSQSRQRPAAGGERQSNRTCGESPISAGVRNRRHQMRARVSYRPIYNLGKRLAIENYLHQKEVNSNR